MRALQSPVYIYVLTSILQKLHSDEKYFGSNPLDERNPEGAASDDVLLAEASSTAKTCTVPLLLDAQSRDASALK